MLGAADGASDTKRLGEELLPCRPDDPALEPRLKAVLRRHVVERCIYGVDLDPLAVELCRLALWVETMDRALPFSFLDHKIRCGNGLIGAWFDQFQHYPVMAWKNREGGDKSHSNGVHFAKDARGTAIKTWTKDTLTPDLQRYLSGRTLFDDDMMLGAAGVHDSALAIVAALHNLPVQDSAERARLYRDELLGSPEWRRLKDAMDLWCACWFWPADEVAAAPVPTTFAAPPEGTRDTAARVATRKRFFHWELEFPDVFSTPASGFHAILGNPPWDIAKPSSKEFFSDIDPLFRTYGKQEAVQHQREYFAEETIERRWLDYSADFRAQSNYVGYSANPFGDPARGEDANERFSISRGRDNTAAHERWRQARRKSHGYADVSHPYRHQGAADVNLYKLFLEQAHALLVESGRVGFIVPSGLYSDYGTGSLRTLFLDHCDWEWLFGFENRDKLFDIHRSYKFNPVIIVKGGRTDAIRTAFMRRSFREWEHAEEIATPYTRAQVERFSPRSRAILEVESKRDLEILEKIYANSVLLGDDGPDGWGVKYATEFHMTNDSKLFPPRPKWEAQGYRPDEYSRWLKGNWRPIAELWPELGIDPSHVVPAEIELEEWLFNSDAGPEERIAGAKFVHGHLLKPGDVQRTQWRVRCAQPPYDSLPVPRADIPAGIILSREADAWIRETEIEDVALPLYEGRMIGQFDFSQKGWVSGKGRSAVWRDISWDHKQIEPQYLIGQTELVESGKANSMGKIAYMRISSSTNARTAIATFLPGSPAGDSVFFFLPRSRPQHVALVVSAILSTFIFDVVVRYRLGGLNMSEFLMLETPLPRRNGSGELLVERLMLSLSCAHQSFAPDWLRQTETTSSPRGWKTNWAIARGNRAWSIARINAAASRWYGLNSDDIKSVLTDCDCPDNYDYSSTRVKGFWRVDRDEAPELRSSMLFAIARTQAAMDPSSIEGAIGTDPGPPEVIALETIGYGCDERSKALQPLASRLGRRFTDWQLAQTSTESWNECHLHARNILGSRGHEALLVDIDRERAGYASLSKSEPESATRVTEPPAQSSLFG